MNIVVLVKQVPDTWGTRKINLDSGWLDRSASEMVIDEISEKVVEIALQLKEQVGASITAMTMGPDEAKEVLRKCLAMGADEAVHISDSQLEGADAVRTAQVLARAISEVDADLVIAGNESTDGGGGIIPVMLAELLDIPHLTNLDTVSLTDGILEGNRASENGVQHLSSALPAVISMTERSAEARYPNFKGIMAAKKKPLTQKNLAEIGLTAADAQNKSAVQSVEVRPARSAGIKIVDDGSAATQVVDYLIAHRVI